ncbi:MAG: hypothetical protein C5S48_07560 [Candidatus Methanogaster sp.]|nr:MAG: hypothetical protein C5S48_07560 [ANME-2 cluster archaeon]
MQSKMKPIDYVVEIIGFGLVALLLILSMI